MARFFKKRSELLGKRPGELVYIGTDNFKDTEIHEIRYNGEMIEEQSIPVLPEQTLLNRDVSSIRWINFDGLGNIKLLSSIRDLFFIPQLTMADILNTTLRPKAEELPHGFFLSLKMLRYDEKRELIIAEQVGMIADKHILLTFQEHPGDVFDTVRKRLHENLGKIRKESAVYLAYSLLDSITDNYIDIMQNLADGIEKIEDMLTISADEKVLESIQASKKELLYLGKAVRPAREAMRILLKESQPLIEESYRTYFSDLIANMTQVIETIDLYKEICNEYLARYNGLMNDKLNETIKFLTVFSVIFLPLTLITGIYGTNFDFIPELHLRYGYLYFWLLLFTLASVMIFIFKRKKWF